MSRYYYVCVGIGGYKSHGTTLNCTDEYNHDELIYKLDRWNESDYGMFIYVEAPLTCATRLAELEGASLPNRFDNIRIRRANLAVERK